MRSLMTMALLGAALVSTSNAAIIGASTGATSGGMLIQGYGDTGPAIFPNAADGKGVLSFLPGFSNCSVSAGLTTCTLSGNYSDNGGTGTPGGGGAFSLQTRFDANRVPGVQVPMLGIIQSSAASSDPNNLFNQFTILALDESVLFTLNVTPSGGGGPFVRYFGQQNLAGPFLNEFGFNFQFLPGAVCTGLAANASCGVGNVSLVSGATISGATTFGFNFDSPTPSVPEPRTLLLLGLGLALVAATRRRATAN